jgi:hypothetical protein
MIYKISYIYIILDTFGIMHIMINYQFFNYAIFHINIMILYKSIL